MSISYLKLQKRGYFYSTDPALTWHGTAMARDTDVACGTSAQMRLGTEATWQGRAWPTRGAGGRTRGRRPRGSTRTPVRGATDNMHL